MRFLTQKIHFEQRSKWIGYVTAKYQFSLFTLPSQGISGTAAGFLYKSWISLSLMPSGFRFKSFRLKWMLPITFEARFNAIAADILQGLTRRDLSFD